MSEKITLYLSEDINETINSQKKCFQNWFSETLALGVLLQRGKLFQIVQDKPVLLRLKDFDPFPQNYPPLQEVIRYQNIELLETTLSEIKKSREDATTWARRAMTFRLRADNMELVYFDEGEYVPIDTTEDFW